MVRVGGVFEVEATVRPVLHTIFGTLDEEYKNDRHGGNPVYSLFRPMKD
jgi:hypothetical protein